MNESTSPEATCLLCQRTLSKPVDSGRMAYSLMRHVYLGFGVSTDALPFVEIRSGNRAVSKEAFMAFVNKLQR